MPLWTGIPDNNQARTKPSGSRIVKGLGDLGNLDAKVAKAPTKAVRTEVGVKKIPAVTTTTPKKATESSTIGTSAPSAGVFGSWEEWRSVFKNLFPLTRPNPPVDVNASYEVRQLSNLRAELARFDILDAKALQGLSSMDIWRLRARPHAHAEKALRVPRYAEATAVIAEAQMLDRAFIRFDLRDQVAEIESELAGEDTPPPPTASTNVIRPTMVANSYGGAISRALHILTGGLIRSNSFDAEESSYRSRAQEIGFPEEAVEVRRRVAHGNMPLLSELRLTSALIMGHLHDRYWALQDGQIKKLLRLDEREEKNAKRKREREGDVSDDDGEEAGVIGTPLTTPSNRNNTKGNKKGQSNASNGSKKNTKKPSEPANAKPSVSAADVLALLGDLSDEETA